MKNCMKSWDDSLEYLDTSNNNYDEEEDVITLVMEHGQYSVQDKNSFESEQLL